MLDYALKDSTRKKMAREPRAVQIAISKIANEKFGSPHDPQGIGKYEGGVRVNNREICIRKNNVSDDWKRYSLDPTPEEQAVIDAITQISETIEKNGLKSIRPYFNEQFYMADPLRSMLDVGGPQKPSRWDRLLKLLPWR